jgi:hypothetical protein
VLKFLAEPEAYGARGRGRGITCMAGTETRAALKPVSVDLSQLSGNSAQTPERVFPPALLWCSRGGP